MQPRAIGGPGAPCLWPLRPSRQLSLPSLGAPAATWLWHAGLVPSLGQARPGLPERQRKEVAIRCCVLCCSHAFWGFLIIVTRKPLPPTLLSLRAVSLRWCPQVALVLWSSFTGPPCAQRPPEGPSGHPDAMLHQGAFYIQLYYFYYYETFPPNSINTAFQLGGLF